PSFGGPQRGPASSISGGHFARRATTVRSRPPRTPLVRRAPTGTRVFYLGGALRATRDDSALATPPNPPSFGAPNGGAPHSGPASRRGARCAGAPPRRAAARPCGPSP